VLDGEIVCIGKYVSGNSLAPRIRMQFEHRRNRCENVCKELAEFIRGGVVWKNKLETNLLAGMYQLTRRNMRRYGGYVVHFGVVLVVIGLAGAAFNRDKEKEMAKGDKLEIGRYTLVGEEYTDDDNANYQSQAALLEVYKDGKFLTRLNPEERRFGSKRRTACHIR
jgi:cytochrome c-type biogenesis protein CcmF